MIVLKGLLLFYMWIVFPVLFGNVWKRFASKEREEFRYTYQIGLLSILAIFYLMARHAISEEQKLSELARNWVIAVAVLSVLSFVYAVRHYREWKEFFCKINKTHLLMAVSGIALIVFCIGFTENVREDWTVESVNTMYMTNTLYVYGPLTGKAVQNMVEPEVKMLEQQALAPVDAYYAIDVFLTKIHPARLVRELLPFFLFPFYFSVYGAWGEYCFEKDMRKRIFFNIIIWLLYAISLFADTSLMFSVYQNCWNGETLFFLGVLPFAVLLLLGEKAEERKLEHFKRPYLILEYVVCALAGQLLYVKGFFFVTFVWCIAFLLTMLKRWKDGSGIRAD